MLTSDRTQLTYAEALRLTVPASVTAAEVEPATPAPPLRLVSSATTTELAAFMRGYARRANRDWRVTGHDYGPLRQQLMALPADGTATVVLVVIEDLLPELTFRGDMNWTDLQRLGDGDLIGERISTGVDAVCAAIRGLDGPCAVVPPVLGPPALPVRSRSAVQRLAALPATIAEHLRTALQPSSALLLDVQRALADLPRDRWGDDVMHLRAGSPFSIEAATRLAHDIDRLLRPAPTRKVLVTDLDGTLWAGVLADDGADRVGGEQPHDGVHRVWQRLLQAARAQGVLLAVCSRNDPGALDAFRDPAVRERAGLLLEPDAFSAVSTAWEPKSAQLRELASRLNVGLDAMVLVDDNPVEVAEVSQVLPEVLALRFPADGRGLSDFCAVVQDAFVVSAGVMTAEDRSRAELYRLREQAEQARAEAPSTAAFLASLNMSLTLEPATGPAADRAQQLLNRTNQFTLTGRRYDDAAWAAQCVHAGRAVFVGRLLDTYGDHGICVVVMIDDAPTGLDLVEFAISCRVFHRGVETAVLRWLVARGRGHLTADWMSTGRNERVREALAAHGATERVRPAAGVVTLELCDQPALWAAECAVATREPSGCA
jgi:FkbH-like protein